MATAMDVPGLQGGGLNADLRVDALGAGKIPKIVHQGWLKKKGKLYLGILASRVYPSPRIYVKNDIRNGHTTQCIDQTYISLQKLPNFFDW